MLRKCVLGLAAAAVATMAIVAWRTDGTAQQPVNGTARQDDPLPPPNGKALKPSNPLPIKQVVLFNSGVGYFQRSGPVEGEARVDLQFSAGNINDLIKSLVIEDQRGTIMPLRYDSQEPIEKTLRSFAIDLSTNPSFGQILNQARGEKIEVTLNSNAATGLPATMNGTIIGMESQVRPGAVAGQPAGEIELLNLMCAEGLRCVPLKDVQRLRFLNPTLEQELRRALEVVAIGHDSLKKSVRLDFKGDGKRDVKVGYVVENPIWKTSYRIVLNGKEKPRLVGWANVENTSDEDWSDVKLTLVASRPISFQMDLYPPLYIPRPTVEPELFASLRPPTYQGPLANWVNNPGFGMQGAANTMPNFNNDMRNSINPMTGQPQQGFIQGGGFQGQFGNLGAQFGNLGAQFGMQGNNRYQQQTLNVMNAANSKLTYQELQGRRNVEQQNKANQQQREQAQQLGSMITNIDPNLVEAALTTEELGNPARYSIDQSVSLPRQQSAMLPILDQPIEATRVSIYNQSVQAKHPLFGLKIKNTSKQSLMQGPITIYDGEQYMGDARVFDLQPGEERFLSYAIDTGVEIKPFDKVAPGPEMTATVQAGQLNVQYKLRQTRTYVIVNRSPEARSVVIEQPVRDGWKLVLPEKPAERTRDLYRFTATVKPGETVKYEVAEELPRIDPFAVTKQTDWTGFATTLGLDVWTENKHTPEEEFTIQIVPAEPRSRAANPAANAPPQPQAPTQVPNVAIQAPNLGWKGDATKPSFVTSGPGELRVTHKDRRLITYFIRNRVSEERTLWLEHVVTTDRKLIGDVKPVTDDAHRYRFKLALPAGQTIRYQVNEEFDEAQPEVFPLKFVEGTPPPRPGSNDLPQMRYVTELGFEVWTEKKKHDDTLMTVKFTKGQVDSVTKEAETMTYHVRNRSTQPRNILVEHVVRQDWTFAGKDQPVAGAGQRYRFPLKSTKDEVLHQAVTEEHHVTRGEALSALAEQQVKDILASNSAGAQVKETLRKGWSMHTALIETQATLTELRAQLKAITEEQARLRQNIEKLPNDSTLYKRYLEKLDKEETGLEKVQTQITEKVDSEKKQKKELEKFLDNLNVG